jgi:hypothetical protein
VQITSTTNIIASPARNFASLEQITEAAYQYTLELNVNKSAVSNANAVSLVVRTYYNDPLNIVSPSIFSKDKTSTVLEQNPLSIISKIQSQAIVNTSQIMSVRTKYLTISSFSLLDLVEKNNNGIGYATVNDETVSDELYSVATNSNNINRKPLDADRTISQISLNFLKEEKTDPAQAIVRTYATNTAFDTNNGVLGVASSSPLFNEQLNTIASELLSSNNQKQKEEPPNYKVYMIAEQEEIPVRFSINFEKEKVGTNNFYVLCTIYDDKNNILQEFTEFVDNATNVSFFEKPRIPPAFQVYQKTNGQLAFVFTQKDRNASGILVYQTVYNQSESVINSTQNLVGKFQVGYQQTETFLVENNNFGLLLFRALSYNGIDTSTDFSSQVIQINPPNEDITNNNIFLTLNYQYVDQGLKVTATNIPNEIAWIKLYKTNITISPDIEELLTTFNVGGMGKNNAFAYLDSVLDTQKNYRYRATVLDIYGNELDSTGLIELSYRPQVAGNTTVTVTEPVTTILPAGFNSSLNWDVTFDISYAIVPGLEQNVRNLLTNQNLIQYYGQDIIANDLQQMLVTKVELRDLETNDNYFIAFTDGTFIQSQTKFGPIKKQSRYVYELTTYIRHPTTSLQGNVQTGKSQPRPSTSNVALRLPTQPEYSYLPFNVRHPEGLLTGTVPKNNGNEFVTATGYNQLEFGEVTNISYVYVDLVPPIASVTSLQALKFNKDNIQLSWSVDGDQTKISHFIIRRQNNFTGKIDLIGKAHGINVQNNYGFVDSIRPTDTGVYQYIVTIQFFDMTLSADYVSNEVVI